jgi:membrane protein YdbS with pleckstrin-like domain
MLLSIPVISVAVSGVGTATIVISAVWFGVTLLMTWAARRWPVVSHRHASYRLDPLGIQIRRGVIWRAVVNIPRSRVQHTDVAQGPLERKYGLGRLIIYTAGSSHAQVTVHGLDHQVALRVRDLLLPLEGGDAL